MAATSIVKSSYILYDTFISVRRSVFDGCEFIDSTEPQQLQQGGEKSDRKREEGIDLCPNGKKQAEEHSGFRILIKLRCSNKWNGFFWGEKNERELHVRTSML
jgi:hypothetical protein